MFLRVHSKLKMNIIDKLPPELNSSRLPLSFQYYETVPVLMSRCLQVIIGSRHNIIINLKELDLCAYRGVEGKLKNYSCMLRKKHDFLQSLYRIEIYQP